MIDKDTEKLFKNLKKIRLQKNITQTEASELMGFNLSSSLSHVESAKKSISIDKLIIWLKILNLDLNNIVQDYHDGIDFNLIHTICTKMDANQVNAALNKILNSSEDKSND